MKTLGRAAPVEQPGALRGPDAIIPEARRRGRRRRGGIAALTFLVVAAVAGAVVYGGGSPPKALKTSTPARPNGAFPSRARSPDRAASVSLAPLHVYGVGVLSVREVWAAASTSLLVSSDGGARWRSITPTSGPMDWFDDLAAAGGGQGHGNARELFFSLDNVPTAPVNPAEEGGSTSSQLIGRSTDGGRDWFVDAFADSQLQGVTLSFPDAVDGFALGGSALAGFSTGGQPNSLYRTTDGGARWEEVGFADIEGPLDFPTTEHGWALPKGLPGAQRSLELTADGGVTWQAVNPAGAPAAYLGPPQFFGPADAVVAAELLGSSGRPKLLKVLRTADAGLKWTAVTVPAAVLPAQPASAAARDLLQPAFQAVSPTTWVLATGSQLLTTTDAGAHWAVTEQRPWRGRPPQSLAFTSGSNGVADIGGSLERTADAGRSWHAVTAQAVPSQAPVRTVADYPTSSASVAFAGRWSGGIPRLALPAGTDVTGLSCSSAARCTAVDGAGQVAVYNGTGWSHLRRVDEAPLTKVSCAANVCLAVDRRGDVVLESGGVWSRPQSVLPGGVIGVSCSPSGRLCAAVGPDGAKTLRLATAPAKAPYGWSSTELLGQRLDLVSCSSASFCLALADTTGYVYNGLNWSATPPSAPIAGPPLRPRSVSCATSTFCVVIERSGRVAFFLGDGWVTGTRPGFSGGPPFDPVTVSCSEEWLCVAPNATRSVSVLGRAGWLEPSDLGLATGALFASCTGPVTCLAVDVGGRTFRFRLGGK